MKEEICPLFHPSPFKLPLIRRSRQFPYQFLAAYLSAADVPQKIKAALHQAAEIACGNVPELLGPVLIGLDTSGSMSSAVTGYRGRGGTSKMRCVDVATDFRFTIGPCQRKVDHRCAAVPDSNPHDP